MKAYEYMLEYAISRVEGEFKLRDVSYSDEEVSELLEHFKIVTVCFESELIPDFQTDVFIDVLHTADDYYKYLKNEISKHIVNQFRRGV